jgi:hypothetical protein
MRHRLKTNQTLARTPARAHATPEASGHRAAPTGRVRARRRRRELAVFDLGFLRPVPCTGDLAAYRADLDCCRRWSRAQQLLRGRVLSRVARPGSSGTTRMPPACARFEVAPKRGSSQTLHQPPTRCGALEPPLGAMRLADACYLADRLPRPLACALPAPRERPEEPERLPDELRDLDGLLADEARD